MTKAWAVWLSGVPVSAWISHSGALAEAAKCGGEVIPCIISVSKLDFRKMLTKRPSGPEAKGES